MGKNKAEKIQRETDFVFSHKGNAILSHWLSHSHLKTYYRFDVETAEFQSKRQNFLSNVSLNPEKEFYELFEEDFAQHLLQSVSESDRVKYFLIYQYLHHKPRQQDESKWIADAIKKHMHRNIKSRVIQTIENEQSKWSQARKKLIMQLIKQIDNVTSINKRMQYYIQLEDLAMNDNTSLKDIEHPLVQKFNGTKREYQAQSLKKDLTDNINPILYYPETDRQQASICKNGRNCFYLDKDTKDLFYINSRGTSLPVSSPDLISTHLHQIKKSNDRYELQYRNILKKTDSIYVAKIESKAFGTGFLMNQENLHILAQNLPIDPIVRLANQTLKNLIIYERRCFRMPKFFTDTNDTTHENMFGLIQIKEMLERHPTQEIQYFTRKPMETDFSGHGPNTYVFFRDPAKPDHYEFWHVDRSSNIPLLTKLSLNTQDKIYLNSMYLGMTKGEKPEYTIYDTFHPEKLKNTIEWYQIGQDAEKKESSDGHIMTLKLSEFSSMRIPQLFASHFPPCQYLIEDWTYYEAYNELTQTLALAKQTTKNISFLDRCEKIQQHLELIGQDYYGHFSQTRGLVPQEQRRNILKILTELVKNPQSEEALHFLRTQHRVYHESFQEDRLEHYETSSFVWSKDSLYYINEQKKAMMIPITNTLLQKLSTLDRHSPHDDFYISAKDVYYLMSRPSFPYFIWEKLTYCLPWKADRKGCFHTGTAQEMLYEIHDMKLSWRAALYQVLKIVLLVVVPTILAAFGFAIPLFWLGLKGISMVIFNWTMIAWNAEFVFQSLRCIGHTVLHPELKQLDTMLQSLNDDFSKINSDQVEQEDTGLDEDDFLLPHSKYNY